MLAARILIADDNPNDRFLISKALQAISSETNVEFVRDGREVVEYLENCQKLPSVLLLDLRMTRMNAFDVLLWLRERPRFAKIPVAIISGSKTEEEATRAKELGAQCFVTKPYSFSELRDMLKSLTLES